MAVTQNQYTGNGSTVLFSFTFPYLVSTDVKVKVDGTDTTAYTLANATTVQMNAAPANGAVVIVYRNTDNDNKKATFYPGSAIKAEDLNNDFDQILYVAQEVDNNALNSLGTSPMQGNLSMGNNKLTNLATPTAGTDAAHKTYVDAQASSAIDGALAAGTDLSKATSSGVTTYSHNVTGANQTVNNSNGTVLQDITITAQGHVTSAGSTDLDTRYYTKTTLDGGHFDSRYYTETELNAGQLNNQYYTETELDAGQLDNRYYTETELNAGQLDNRYYTEAELNAGQLDTRYFRQDSSETISQGDTWSGNDNYIATTAAIDARIVDLVEDVGGFVPIANETSFPTSNPDVNNAAGTLISIKAMASTRTPSGGVVSISDGAGSGVTVTINGCGTTVLTAGYGVILETTSTTHTYNFHRLSASTTAITTVSSNISNINAVAANETNINAVNNNSTNINAVANNNANITSVAGNATNINAVAPNVSNISAVNANATNINTVAGNNTNINTVATNAASVSTVATNISSVNNFADRYRVASSAPSSSLDVGDLYFDTSGNELKVYNGSAWQGGVTATGNLVSKNGDQFTGNITFSGSQTVDGRDLSVDGTKLDTIATNANNYAISSDLLDQDDLVSNSATKVASQQSVKAYVDNQTLSLIDEDDMSTNSATRPPSQQSVKAYADTKAPLASPALTGTATAVNLTLSGDLTVNGTTTTLNSTTVSIDDKNLELGKVSTPTDTTADGGGITLKGGTDKTFNWVDATDAWTSSEHIHLGDSKILKLGTDTDAQLTHTGSYGSLNVSTGYFVNDIAGDWYVRNSAGGENRIIAKNDGAVELYHDNAKKIETTSSGINVTGAINVNGAALASGNTFTAVANGAIANNKAVKLDTDGKVSEIAATTVADSSPSISTNLSTNGNYVTGTGEEPEDVKCIWIGNNKVLITWIKDNFPSGGKQGVKGVVGSWVDSGAVGYYSNWGAEFTLVNNTRRLKYDVCWDETNDTIIVSYVDEDDSGKGKSVYVKRSGTTLSFISSGTTPVTWRSSSSTKTVRTYWDNSIQRQILTYESSSGQGHAVVAAKNSSDDSYTNTYANEITNGDTIWDMFVAVCGLTSGKVIYFWNQGNANVYYRIGVVNTGNNTIAWSTDNSNNGILVATRHMYCDCAYNADKGIVSFVGRKTDTSNSAVTQLAAFDNSNNSVGSWTQQGLGTSSEGMAVAYCPDAKNLHYFYMRGSSPNYWSSRAITHGTAGNAASYTISSAIDTFGTGSSSTFSHVTRITPSPGLGVITGAARGHNINNRLTSQNVGTTTQQSNLTHARHYVGYVDQAYTNGQTATIKTYGNTVTTLSGLTIGSIYYVQGNGTVGTSVDSTLSFSTETPGAGLAITATTLLIKDPFLGKVA